MKKILLITALAALFVSLATVPAHGQKKKTETVVFETSITCNHCKMKIEENIPFEKGVKDVKVDIGTKKVSVTYDPSKTDPEEIRKAIEELGYKAKQAEPATTTVPNGTK